MLSWIWLLDRMFSEKSIAEQMTGVLSSLLFKGVLRLKLIQVKFYVAALPSPDRHCDQDRYLLNVKLLSSCMNESGRY